MKSVARLMVSAVTLAPTIAAAAYQTCAPERILAPAATIQTPPQNSLGCTAGAVIRLPDGSSVWRCTTGTGASLASNSAVLLVSADGSSKRLPDSTPQDGIFRMSVWLIDLNNDGREERILSYWNGLGESGSINSWTAIVFRADWAALTPIEENNERKMAGASDIHDWGLNNLVKDPGNASKCLLAVSEFKAHNSVNGMRVDFYELGQDSLTPSTTLPPVFRPLNARFRSERRRDYRSTPYSGNIARWISSRDVKQLPKS